MGDAKTKRTSRTLRFAVSGALLVAPLVGCGGSSEHAEEAEEETHVNVPAAHEETSETPPENETPTVNEGPSEK
jgi:hypothetical protein